MKETINFRRSLIKRIKTKPKHPVREFFLLVTSETLAVAGLSLLLFAIWQLYWTDLETKPIVSAALEPFPVVEEECTPAPVENKDNIPQLPTDIPEGEVYGVIHIPKWGEMRNVLAQGAVPWVLDQGFAGHYIDTQQVGEIGNFAVAGHRRTYGSNFRRLDILEEGDPVVIETDDAWYVYKITGSEIVLPSQGEVLYPVPNQLGEKPTVPLMTMTTCHPEYGNSERLIAYAEFDYWVPMDGCPPEPLLHKADETPE